MQQAAAATLRDAHAEIQQRVLGMFDALQALHRQLQQAEAQLAEHQRELTDQRAALAAEQQEFGSLGITSPDTKLELAEVRQQNTLLQEELAALRRQTDERSQVIAQQQQLQSSERAEWTTELVQLRQILDNQAKWLQQRSATLTSEHAFAEMATHFVNYDQRI